ncbi:MAG TPA: serine/threonine-protein kinase [Burkholderiales bacterium]
MATRKQARIGRYKIAAELGRGAMGVVYKAKDPVLDRTVALKTIGMGEDASGRSEYQARFFLEAKAAGKLNHPNIITIHDYGEEGELAWMAMELLEGTELRARMQEGQVPLAEAIDIAQQVAEGLGYAHEHGVVHRDIKPSNIMLMKRGKVKIMDFGIARMRASDLKTSTGVVLGTPRYMSPEQVAGEPVDHRSDIFSLGTVLYEMLTRTSLFAGNDTPQILHNVQAFQPVAPSRLNPEVPAMLDFVVARALKKEPDVRYQDAYEMAADLRACLAELRGREPEPEGERSATKTIKLDAEPTRVVAPAAGAIGSDTRLPLSARFDCTAALDRLVTPGRRDAARLRRAPRPVGLARRLLRDPGQRLLFTVALAAAVAGGMIAFG